MTIEYSKPDGASQQIRSERRVTRAGLPEEHSEERLPKSGTIAASAPLAQLDRAADFESVGREFESLRARQTFLNVFRVRLAKHGC